jgi:hypothetical protein
MMVAEDVIITEEVLGGGRSSKRRNFAPRVQVVDLDLTETLQEKAVWR